MNANMGTYAVGAVAAVCLPAYFLINRWAQGGVYSNNDARIDGKVVIITGCNHNISRHCESCNKFFFCFQQVQIRALAVKRLWNWRNAVDASIWHAVIL